MKETAVIIQTTTNDKNTASKIASFLLESRKVACVQISSIESHYSWGAKIVSDQELLLTIKTVRSLGSDVMNIIKTLHNYSVPEIIQISVDETSSEYLSWLIKETKQPIAH